MFTRVFRVRNAESELEIEAFEEFISEVMTFDHSKIVDWFITYSKLYPAIQEQEIVLLGSSHGSHFSGFTKFLDFSSIFCPFSSIFLKFCFLTENLIQFIK